VIGSLRVSILAAGGCKRVARSLQRIHAMKKLLAATFDGGQLEPSQRNIFA